MRILYQSPPLASSVRWRTFAALSAYLLGAGVSVGWRATLFGPSERIGTWEKVSASALRLASSWLDLSEFTVGALGSGADLEHLGSAPTWATPGASGGLILSESGVLLPCLGVYPGAAARSVWARGVLTIGDSQDDQEISAGTAVDSRGDSLHGGLRRASGTGYSSWGVGDPSSPSMGGSTTAPYSRSFADSDEVLIGAATLVTDVTSGRGGYLVGGYAGGTGDSTLTSVNAADAETNHDDGLIYLHLDPAAGALSARITRIVVASLQREADEA